MREEDIATRVYIITNREINWRRKVAIFIHGSIYRCGWRIEYLAHGTYSMHKVPPGKGKGKGEGENHLRRCDRRRQLQRQSCTYSRPRPTTPPSVLKSRDVDAGTVPEWNGMEWIGTVENRTERNWTERNIKHREQYNSGSISSTARRPAG